MSTSALTASASTPSYTGPGSNGGFSGSGTFVTTSNGDGSYLITNVTSDAGAGVDSLLPPASFHGNDNELYPTSTSLVDPLGFAFTDTQGDTDFTVDVSATGSGVYAANFLDSDGVTGSVPVNFTIASNTPSSSTPKLLALSTAAAYPPKGTIEDFNFTFAPAAVAPTPEPSALVLLGTGLVGAYGAARKRIKL